MLLADAAKVSEALRAFYQDYLRDAENRSAHFRKCLDIVRVAVRNADDDLTQLIEMLYPEHSKYPRQFISFRELRDDVCKKLSISPLVWDEALAGKPLVPLLALESPEFGGEGMTVKQALNLMARIRDDGFLQIAGRLNEREALAFWSRATGERPPLPVKRFLQMVSYLTVAGAQSLQAIDAMLYTMRPGEVMQRLLAEKPDLEVRTMQPGQPFTGPVYRAWDKMTAPTDVYAEVISNPRRYLHVTEFPTGTFRGVLYSRDKQAMGKPVDLPYAEQECIMEVETDGITVTHVTDLLALGDDWDIHRQPYRERIDVLRTLNLQVPLKEGKFVASGTDFTHLLETIEPAEKLRLVHTEGIKVGGDGGWAILKDAFHVQLLANSIMRDAEYDTFVRLGALDGFEVYEVGQVKLSAAVAQHVRQRLAQQGVLVGQDWLPIDEYGLVVVLEVKGFSLSDLSLTEGDVRYLDDNLGYSDVSQLTDLIEMSD
tara:strand:+ start:221 stop:1675 length:1455 start_codon:yes stop_codon:yes gene_type:complete